MSKSAHPTKRRAEGAKRPAAQLWIKLTIPGVGQIGPGKIELLRRIEQERSIAAAARSMGMSYRRAWLLIDELNGLFDEPVVVTRIGGSERGGAMLTPLGAKLVRSYDEIVSESTRACASLLETLTTAKD